MNKKFEEFIREGVVKKQNRKTNKVWGFKETGKK